MTRGLRKYIGKNTHFSILQTLRLIQYIERSKPDLIHLHVLHHGCTDYELLFQYLVRKGYPVIYTLHDMWTFTGGCYHYTTVNCHQFEEGCRNCPARANQLDVNYRSTAREFLNKRTLLAQLANLQIVAVSNWVKEEAQKSFLSKYPIHVIANGVEIPDESYSNVACEKTDNDKIRLISVAASWNQRKGIDIIFKLAGRLDERFEIYLIGNAPNELRDAAPKNIHFLGYCKDKMELYRHYREADLHFSASQEETYGMTFVEAALMGCRSVGYASTAIKDTLISVHGVVVEHLTVEALHKAILSTIDHHMNSLSISEVEEIRQRVSLTKMAEDYLKLYEKIVNG